MSYWIRLQADDFFAAYQTLKDGNLPMASPVVVNLAFAIELYIKDLHYLVSGNVPRGHNILRLHKKLPEEVRLQIFNHEAIRLNPFHVRGNIFSPKLYSKSYTPEERFLDQLKAISDGFEKWRYSYESTPLNYDEGFALALIEALKFVADGKRVQSAA